MIKELQIIILVLAFQFPAYSFEEIDTSIASLSDMTVDALRQNAYGSKLTIVSELTSKDYQDAYSKDGSKPYRSYMATYNSDGLRIYTRVDVPSTPIPKGGYPVVIYAHGYAGIKDAPTYHFSYDSKAYYGSYIDKFVDAGFVVLAPGYRGHGTVKGVPADGIEFMRDWDNGSYLSTVFYAKDVLNLLDSVQTLEGALKSKQKTKIDLENINLTSHSQGGDVALMVVAVNANGSKLKNRFKKASIWSGTFPDRFTQVETYAPMQNSPQAFMSGDGTWTGSPKGNDGSINYDFVFPYPAEWIVTTDRSKWGWQKETFHVPTVAQSVTAKYRQMYSAINKGVGDINDANFSVVKRDGQKTQYQHDDKVQSAMQNIGAYHRHDLIDIPLSLHYPDRDFYSLPKWNKDLCGRVNAVGGKCMGFIYPGNTHSMRLSKHKWFSPLGSLEGFDVMISRDIKNFKLK